MSQDAAPRDKWVIVVILAVLAISLSVGILHRSTDTPVDDFTPTAPTEPPAATRYSPAAQALDGASDPAECADEVSARLDAMSASQQLDNSTDMQYLAQQKVPEAQATLFASTDPELRFAGLFLYTEFQGDEVWDRNAARSVIGNMLVPDSTNPALLWHELRLCSVTQDAKCTSAAVEERAIAMARDNSEIWAQVAVSRNLRGDTAGALEAMRQAGSAPTSTFYRAETIQMIERALRAANLTFEQRSRIAIGAAHVEPDFHSIQQMCVENSRTDQEWSRACRAYGAVIARQHQMWSARMFGMALQLSVTSDPHMRSELVARFRELGDEINSLSRSPLENVVQRMVWSSPRYFHDYWTINSQQGHLEAIQSFAELEVPEFLRQIGLSDCTSALMN